MGRYLADLFSSRPVACQHLRSMWLGAMPTFWSGCGSVVDIGGTLLTEYNMSNSAEQADARALYSDWKLVGFDLDQAIVQYRPIGCEQTARRVAR